MIPVQQKKLSEKKVILNSFNILKFLSFGLLVESATLLYLSVFEQNFTIANPLANLTLTGIIIMPSTIVVLVNPRFLIVSFYYKERSIKAMIKDVYSYFANKLMALLKYKLFRLSIRLNKHNNRIKTEILDIIFSAPAKGVVIKSLLKNLIIKLMKLILKNSLKNLKRWRFHK